MQPQDETERSLHAEYRRKQVRLPPAKMLGNVMSQLLARRGYAQVQSAALCEAAWRQAVGEKLARDTRPGNVRRGVLEVLVRNSSINQELAFVKAQIIKKLTALAPEQKIKSVKFRVGPIE